MWSWHPKPWQHGFDFALMIGGPLVASRVPEIVHNETGPALGFVLGSTLILCGGAVWVCSNVAMVFDKRVETIRNARMLEQPTTEERNGEKHFIREVVRDTVVTSGNVRIPVDKMPEAVRKIPEGFVAMQNTAQVVNLSEVDNAIKKICRRNVILVEHPELGFPRGDFREVTWVTTKEMSRHLLLVAIGILERHGGIERAGTNGNSTRIVKDLDVIKRGARTPLPHPVDCWCGCQNTQA